MKVLMLHGYSATNAGDGLLVEESINVLREALGSDVTFTVTALHPETFAHVDAHVIDARPTARGWSPEYRDLRGRMAEFDIVVGVGGGYLRAGTLTEYAKTLLAHAPQLRLLNRYRGPIVYLPQSVGPFRWDIAGVLRRLLRRVDTIYLRDDRSVAELKLTSATRIPDLALLSSGWAPREVTPEVAAPTVLTTRFVGGRLPKDVVALAEMLTPFDGYVQSTGAGNDDTAAVAQTAPSRILERQEFLGPGTRRVVVAVRLHAALMALRAGHWVIHLAYERKGFGAFADLGLPEYVHNVNSFDPTVVFKQVDSLRHQPETRKAYDSQLKTAQSGFAAERARLVRGIRSEVPVFE